MDALIQYFKDTYTSAELVDEINIDIDELLYYITPYLREHLNEYKEHFENIYGIIEED